MVESSPKVFAALEANARLLDASGRLQTVRSDAVKFASLLRSSGTRFDVLFLDPPYRQGWLDRLMPVLPDLVTEDGLVYVEAEHELRSCGPWETVRHGRAGQVFFHLMQRGRPNGAEQTNSNLCGNL